MHLFTECCDSIQVFYGSTNQEYTYGNIYGYYVRQEDFINGRPWLDKRQPGVTDKQWLTRAAQPTKPHETRRDQAFGA